MFLFSLYIGLVCGYSSILGKTLLIDKKKLLLYFSSFNKLLLLKFSKK